MCPNHEKRCPCVHTGPNGPISTGILDEKHHQSNRQTDVTNIMLSADTFSSEENRGV